MGKFDHVDLTNRVIDENPFSDLNETRLNDIFLRSKALIAYQTFADKVIENCQNGNKIVNIGSGTGMASFYIGAKLPDSHIICIEENENLHTVGEENLNLCYWGGSNFNIELKHSDLTDLPVEDNYADVVYSQFSIKFWKDPVKVIQECIRICKTDGIILIEDFNRLTNREYLDFILDVVQEGAEKMLHDVSTGYSVEEVKTILQDANLNDWKVEPFEICYIIKSK